MRVTKEFVFHAAHRLPRYRGKCERLHGHTFKLHVTVEGPVDPVDGMTFDFRALKRIVNDEVIDVLDHSNLNDMIENPSAENVAIWVWGRIREKVSVPLVEVKVWETPTSFVTYAGE